MTQERFPTTDLATATRELQLPALQVQLVSCDY